MTVATTPAVNVNGALPPRARTIVEQSEWLGTLQAPELLTVARGLLADKVKGDEKLHEMKARHANIEEQVEALTAENLYAAVVAKPYDTATGSIEVACDQNRILVSVMPEVDRERLKVGTRCFVTEKRNCLVRVDAADPTYHEVGTFEGYLPGEGNREGLLRSHDDLIRITLADKLKGSDLSHGDLIGFSRVSEMGFAKIEQPGKRHLFHEDTPPDRFEELGGLDNEIARLKRAVEFRLRHASIAERYRLKGKRGILLEGPPGNGKTKLARCLARYIADLTPRGECRFMAVAGSSDYSMWLGQSEQRIGARFDAAEELAKKGGVPVLMFFDELDALGRRRGTDHGSGAPDRILSTFLARLDGVGAIDNIVVMGATNRADTLDPGLLRPGRLGDFRIRVPQPNRAAALAILGHYLKGLPTTDPHEALVQAAAEYLYDPLPNSDVAVVTFYDGTSSPIRRANIVSGAMLENVVRTAAEEAANREATTGTTDGVRLSDLIESINLEVASVARTLTEQNVAAFIPDMPGEPQAVTAL